MASARTYTVQFKVKSHDRLVMLSFHLQPINVVVFNGSMGPKPGSAHLEVGFPLRCIQRLSVPHVATQRCSWRHNWYTRDASIPVLSY